VVLKGLYRSIRARKLATARALQLFGMVERSQ